MEADVDDVLLKACDVSIEFGGLCAVSGFSCEIRRGELVGLIGPNGAGKTTLFNIFSGVYTPSAGDVFFRDRYGRMDSLRGLSPAIRNHIGISRTFQNIRLFGNLSVEDNVRIALHSSREVTPVDVLFRLPRFRRDEQEMLERTGELLSLFKIEEKRHFLAKNLPYGEQRKLEIARALAANPVLLLLDEPAAGMNGQETEELSLLITKIREDFKLTILLIEHDMRFVMGLCRRLVVLDYGKTIAAGTPSEVSKNPAVIKAYLGSTGVAS